MYKKLGIIIAIIAVILVSNINKKNDDTVFQVSTINALLEGVYDSNLSIKELSQNGNFGIGTFNALDGEMIALDGKFYQVKADGKVYKVNSKEKTPFASVTDFKADKTILITDIENYKKLKETINKELKTNNIFYAIKITGDFDYVKTRSVPRQTKPYMPLVEVVKNQPEFEFNSTKGTLIGYLLPDFVQKINVPDYHLHFLSNDKTKGGHLLECKIKNAKIEIDYKHSLTLKVPTNKDFYQTNISKTATKSLKKWKNN
eukprot:GHVO01070945.1.p2 GENE.GHVO01070945.1~~GHVO01070945.1.p2  ORF type:complete len:259 (+),score=-0.57 GHVO01070945.1:323-1099(+)